MVYVSLSDPSHHRCNNRSAVGTSSWRNHTQGHLHPVRSTCAWAERAPCKHSSIECTGIPPNVLHLERQASSLEVRKIHPSDHDYWPSVFPPPHNLPRVFYLWGLIIRPEKSRHFQLRWLGHQQGHWYHQIIMTNARRKSSLTVSSLRQCSYHEKLPFVTLNITLLS